MSNKPASPINEPSSAIFISDELTTIPSTRLFTSVRTSISGIVISNGNFSVEIELIKSPLVIDRVVTENHLAYGKLYGIIPTKKTGNPLPTSVFLKKGITIENKKGTNVVTISYKTKKPELGYNVVQSIISNYMDLHQTINAQKSQADIKLLETEYKIAKAKLDAKVQGAKGLPTNSMNNSSSIAVMSAFSKSASTALSNIKGQYLEGERSELAIKEEAAKVAELSSKLEWAKMVNALSNTSKVMIIAPPVQPKPYEQTSPKLFTNIILGLVFGAIGALIALIYAETTDKKLTYSALGEQIIYDLEKELNDLKLILLAKQNKNFTFVMFDNISREIYQELVAFKNVTFIKPELSNDFILGAKDADEVFMFCKVGETDAKFYRQIKNLLGEMRKNITKEILL